MKILNNWFIINEQGKDPRLNLSRILLISLILVVCLWLSTLVILGMDDSPGTIGDSFGMMNSLFSALAFALLIYTSLLQREELKLQRKELEENRVELKRSADAHRELVALNERIYSDKLFPFLTLGKALYNSDKRYVMSFIVNGGSLTLSKIEKSDDKDMPILSWSNDEWGSDIYFDIGYKTNDLVIGPIERETVRQFLIIFRSAASQIDLQQKVVLADGRVHLVENSSKYSEPGVIGLWN